MKYLKLFIIAGLSITVFTHCVKDNPSEEPSANIASVEPRDFLSESVYDRLIAEFVYMEGNEPTTETISNLKTFLEKQLNKSEGISVTMSSVPSLGKSAYSLDDIKKLEKDYRTAYPQGSNLASWCFFVDADYSDNEENSKVLGITYSSSSIVIFKKTIREFSNGFGQPSEKVLETTVVEHEFGHILGLVNNGTNMVEFHQDVINGRHCDNKDCLMYFAAEHSGPILNFLSGGIIPPFCEECRNDLKNNGGK